MSTGEASEEQGEVHQDKKRRLQNACDRCRSRKVKCDSATKPDNVCSNCISAEVPCTHKEPIRKRGPKSTYTEELMKRVNFSQELNQMHTTDLARNTSSFITDQPVVGACSIGSTSAVPAAEGAEEEDPELNKLSGYLRQLRIDARFFGRSSGFRLISDAIDIKDKYTGIQSSPQYVVTQCWKPNPWERASVERETPAYSFPPQDLMSSLITIYFDTINPYIPFMHKPTFLRNVKMGLHHHDQAFASVLLLVCAVASTHSDDPRTLVDGVSPQSCGWKWFDQVQLVRRSMFDLPTLYDLQFFILAIFYVLRTSHPQASWTLVGIGLRFCLELGIHRRKPAKHVWSIEDELKKRAFWALVVLDRNICAYLGRPSSLRDEDFDAELPFECDDEYWATPDSDSTTAWKQPPNKPSIVSFFICKIQLCEILAFAMRSIYSIKKSHLMSGMLRDDWEERVVMDLDSAMNRFLNTVPDHLRWDPHRENKLHLNQSAVLYCLYYSIQIHIHRPFIRKDSPMSFTSLTICGSAARSCCRVLDVHTKAGVIFLPYMLMHAFAAGVVLLINLWSGQASGLSLNINRELEDVNKCIRYMRACSDRAIIPSRLADMLDDLASTKNKRPPDISQDTLKKRRRDGEADALPTTATSQAPPVAAGTPESTASTSTGTSSSTDPLATPPYPNSGSGNENEDAWTYQNVLASALYEGQGSTQGLGQGQGQGEALGRTGGYRPVVGSFLCGLNDPLDMQTPFVTDPALFNLPTSSSASASTVAAATNYAYGLTPTDTQANISQLRDPASFGSLPPSNMNMNMMHMDVWSNLPGGWSLNEWDSFFGQTDVDLFSDIVTAR